ncbi:Uncharacterized protein Adt_33188 [Abeliophyllum distichum]|uniref:Uncharacterized protein n=1 Tax=Abeliophyllum distichum TaxID=126358 RepID=A0ABD1QVI9_9LAMI
MAGVKGNEIMTPFEETLAELFHATRAQIKTEKTQFVSPLMKFSNKDKVKIFKSRKSNSCCTEKSKNLTKHSHSGSGSSNRSMSGSTHVTSLQKWDDYTTFEDYLELVMVIEMTPNFDDRIQQMALAIEKLTKSLKDKDAQISTLMH